LTTRVYIKTQDGVPAGFNSPLALPSNPAEAPRAEVLEPKNR
jgi:hypothetical protein